MRPWSRRSAQVNGMWLAFLASILVLGVLIVPLVWDSSRWFGARKEAIVVYCAAGIKQPVEAAARAYEADYGLPIILQYGGSQTLLANAELSEQGDLYLPADDSYIQIARGKELLDEVLPLARMTPTLVVQAGNPLGIHSLDDVLQKDVRLSQANPKAAAIGKLTREALLKSGKWKALERRTLVFKPTVNDVAADVSIGAADVGIVWDILLSQYPNLERVPAAELEQHAAHVSVAVLKTTREPTAALRFARYLAAHDKGLLEFRRAGFAVVNGDRWAERPEINLMAGAMLKPAIDDTVRAFEEREGVRVNRVYNGCGILVSQMKTGEHPDAYFSCDSSFMKQVNDLFLDSTNVSTNQLVILVPKGNPHGVHTLQDLGKKGLRVGVGHENKCAMGALTVQAMREGRAPKQMSDNIVKRAPSGADLVNDLRIGALDAVIAYRSNAADCEDELEWMPVDVPCALAVQPFAVGRDSEFKQLTSRLLDAIRAAPSRERFEANKFQWKN